MRILFINNIPFNPSFGGIERVTDILAKALIARGHDVFYLCFYIGEQQREMLDYDFPTLHYMLPIPGGLQINGNIEYYKALINRLSIDIVVNQRGQSPEYDNVLLDGIKCISVLHSIPDASLRTALQDILRCPQSLLQSIIFPIKLLLYPYLCYNIKSIVRKELSEHYSFIAERSAAIVLLSENYESDFLSYLPIQYNLTVKGIPNPNTYPLQSFNINNKEKVILYVGRLDSYDKCPMRMLRVWKRLYLRHSDWKLLIIGDGPQRDTMQHYISREKMDRVYLLGRKNNVKDYYERASFVCLTSQYEGWGMALTEGMQLGCIPFTFDNFGAAHDIIDDNINGCLIPAYNLRNYANRLSLLMSDAEKRKNMALAAFNKSKMFDVSVIVEQWEKLFYSIMTSN